MNIVVVDIKTKLKRNMLPRFNGNDTHIALTPYSQHILKEQGIKYKTFHDMIGLDEYHSQVLGRIKKIERSDFFIKSENKYYLRDVAKFICLEIYIEVIKEVLGSFECKYLRCSKLSVNNLDEYIDFDEVQFFSCVDKLFYLEKKAKYVFSNIINKGLVKLKSNILPSRKFFTYEAMQYFSIFKHYCVNSLEGMPKINVDLYLWMIEENIYNEKIREKAIDHLADKGNVYIPRICTPFNYIDGYENYFRLQAYRKMNVPIVFFQHGSYVHEDYFLKYNEVLCSDRNVVFNRFTKEMFENYGAKDVIQLEAKYLSKPIKNKKKTFDYIYITHCSYYGSSGTYISSELPNGSADAKNVFERHVDIIKLFGEKYPDKNICIKIQPGIHTGTMNYVPLSEIASKYTNVTIEAVKSLVELFSISEVVISDYYSTEFMNYNLISSKKIILFNDIFTVDSSIIEEVSQFLTVLYNITELDCWIAAPEIFDDKVDTNELIKKYTTEKVDSFLTLSNIVSGSK